MEPGTVTDVQIVRVTDDGRGVGFLSNGKMILIENCVEGDKTVKVKVKRIFAETIIAEKVSRLKSDDSKRKDVVDSPYELDDGSEDGDEEESD